MSERMNFLLPPGRIVQGHPANKQTTDFKGNPKDTPSWYFAVAVEKTNPQVGQILGQIQAFAFNAYNGYAHIQQRIQMGLAGGFAFKIEDGDDPKNQGKEGFRGCWIFKFSTSVGAPGCFDQNMNQIPPESVKTGFYVEVAASVAPNKLTDNNAGIYLNPDGVMLTWFAEEIRQGPSPQQMFAGRQAPQQMPAGASSTPVSHGGFSPNPGQPQSFGGQPVQQTQPQQPGFQQPQQYQQQGFAQQQPTNAQPAGNMAGGPPQNFAGNAAAPSYPSNQQPAGFTQGAPAQAVPGFAGQGPAPSAAQPGYQENVSHSNPGYPGATPHHGFANGGQQ